ncbi:uncharacterized protein LOC131247025 [Magnolia sinica]|uniref:uncharacterized protein LOC131247025 n=1 Tax=Magnolia sinica TaxID=86752 RepID=UPI002657D3C9|nr:uncharacterized protein LOC131247025 [Magnolia sinica]
MPPPRIEKEIRGFLGRIQYISRFIAQLTPICEPIFKLLRKNLPKEWNDDCQTAFDKIKKYLLNPPMLMPPALAEYEACIAGLREAIILNVKKLRVFGDSQLIMNQTNGDWKTKDEMLIPYHVYLENLTEEFEEITFSYMPRTKNQFADSLATLASMLEIPEGVAKWELTVELQEEPAFCLQIDKAETSSNDQSWYTNIKGYLEHQKYPKGSTSTNRLTIQWLAAQFTITGGILYKQSFNLVLLCCVDET